MTGRDLRAAATDPRLRGAPLAVYVYLVPGLDDQAYQPVKIASLAHALGLKDRTAAWAVQRLVHAGYLERGPPGPPGGRVHHYRLAARRG